jgi:hypothetical protein
MLSSLANEYATPAVAWTNICLIQLEVNDVDSDV